MPRIHITPVVLNLLIINVLVWLALNLAPAISPYFVLEKPNYFGIHEEYTQDGRTHYLMQQDGEPRLGPETGQFKPVQLVTSFFSHLTVWHIALNMFALYSFGVALETVMGGKRFLLAYLVIGLGSTLLTALFDPSPIGVLGASGALFGMLVMYAFYFPATRLGLMFIPIQFPIRNFLIGAAVISAGLIAVEVFTGNSVGNISHFGHLMGMIVGFLYLKIGGLRRMVKK
jgi:membrane associated rhomboid family serine protease